MAIEVKINRWKYIDHKGDGIASFNFTLGDIRIRGALFKRRDEGYAVTMPFLRMRDADGKGITAVGLPYSLMQEVLNAAVAFYEARHDYAEPAHTPRMIESTYLSAGGACT